MFKSITSFWISFKIRWLNDIFQWINAKITTLILHGNCLCFCFWLSSYRFSVSSPKLWNEMRWDVFLFGCWNKSKAYQAINNMNFSSCCFFLGFYSKTRWNRFIREQNKMRLFEEAWKCFRTKKNIWRFYEDEWNFWLDSFDEMCYLHNITDVNLTIKKAAVAAIAENEFLRKNRSL